MPDRCTGNDERILETIALASRQKRKSVMDKLTRYVFFQRNDLTIRKASLGVKFSMQGCRIEGRPALLPYPSEKSK